LSTYFQTYAIRKAVSHLSVQTKLDSFFKPALLRSRTSTTSESCKSKVVPCA
jgi:hypothetical protein